MKISINTFGPIETLEIFEKPMMLFIGPQASGKSTIVKIIYFSKHVRDETAKYLAEILLKGNKAFSRGEFTKRIRRRFVEFWGPVSHNRDLDIKMEYTAERWISIRQDREEHRFVTPSFSDQMLDGVRKTLEQAREFQTADVGPTLFPTHEEKLQDLSREKRQLEVIQRGLNELFCEEKEIFFIPAGRSLLATLSEQLQDIHPHKLEFVLREFLDRINSFRGAYRKSLNEIIRERQALTSDKLRFSDVRRVENAIKKILRGEYRYDNEGGKIFVDAKRFTKLSFASSGQQEVVWILLSLFLIALESRKVFIVLEEPEAHLFPFAQKEIVDLVAFFFNRLGCHFAITTHSPYILTSLNNLLAASAEGQKNRESVQSIISADYWVPLSNVGCWFVDQGTAMDITDQEVGCIKAESIDQVSATLAEEFDRIHGF